MRCLSGHLDQAVVDRPDLWMVRLEDSEENLEPEAIGCAGKDGGEDRVDTVVFNLGLHVGEEFALGLEEVWFNAGEFEEIEDEAGDALFDGFEVETHVGSEEAAVLAVVWFLRQVTLHLDGHILKYAVQHCEEESVFGGEVVDEAALAHAGLPGYFVEG